MQATIPAVRYLAFSLPTPWADWPIIGSCGASCRIFCADSAVHGRHLDIHEDQVEPVRSVALDMFDGFLAASSDHDRGTILHQVVLEHERADRIVLDGENGDAGEWLLPPGGRSFFLCRTSRFLSIVRPEQPISEHGDASEFRFS